MKRLAFAFVAASLTVLSCASDPRIVPDPFDASINDTSSSSSSSSSGSPLPGDGSGTRLKRYVYKSDDGYLAADPIHAFDTVLGFDCVPRQTPDGLRCTPAYEQNIAALFSDSACTVRAMYVSLGCPAKQYGGTYVTGQCGAAPNLTLYNITPSQSAKSYAKSGMTCQESNDQPSKALYDIGPEVDYTQFAAMTLEHE